MPPKAKQSLVNPQIDMLPVLRSALAAERPVEPDRLVERPLGGRGFGPHERAFLASPPATLSTTFWCASTVVTAEIQPFAHLCHVRHPNVSEVAAAAA